MSGTKFWVISNKENGQGLLTHGDYSSLYLPYRKNTSHDKNPFIHSNYRKFCEDKLVQDATLEVINLDSIISKMGRMKWLR